MASEEHEELQLSDPAITAEDIEQEHFIRQFLGQKSSKAVLRLKHTTKTNIQLFNSLPDWVEPTEPWEKHQVDLEVVGKLIDWAHKQSNTVQAIIWDFLDQPTNDSLSSTLSRLIEAKVLTKEQAVTGLTTESARTMTDLIRDRLPATKEELITHVQRMGNKRRPAMTVRQFIRVDLKREKIRVDPVTGIISMTEEYLAKRARDAKNKSVRAKRQAAKKLKNSK